MNDSATRTAGTRSSLTIKSMLAPFLAHPRTSQVIKWAVYSLLIINFLFYLYDDSMAFIAGAADDIPWAEAFEWFATSIDMVAWLGLVFIFELETYSLTDDAYEGGLGWILFALRAICYIAIIYAAYGYTVNTLDNYTTSEVPGIADLCQVADQDIWLQLDVIEYAEITSENCTELSAGPPFYRIDVGVALIDAPTLNHVQKLGWLDITNAYAWIIIVLLIELEVWLQAADRFGSRSLKVAHQVSTALYGVLFLNVLIWSFNGYALYAYDSLLWIVGFWAIELNLAEWERDRVQELSEQAADKQAAMF